MARSDSNLQALTGESQRSLVRIRAGPLVFSYYFWKNEFILS